MVKRSLPAGKTQRQKCTAAQGPERSIALAAGRFNRKAISFSSICWVPIGSAQRALLAWGQGGESGKGRDERGRAPASLLRSVASRSGRGDYITCAVPPLREDVACSLAASESPRLPRELGERNWRRSTPGGSALQHAPISSRSCRPGRRAAATSGRRRGAEVEPAPSGESGPSP